MNKHIEVAIIRRETPRAFQVIPKGKYHPFLWLPKSRVENADDFSAGQRDVTFEIPQWLFDKKMQEARSGDPWFQ